MKNDIAGKNRSRWLRFWHSARFSIIALIVLFVGARIALPFVLKDYVNRQLRKLPDYSGQIGKVTVHLWRGAYSIHDIDIKKSEGNVPAPFFSTPLMDLSLQWKELFHGSVVAKVLLDKPEVNFVGGPADQTGKNQPWGETLEHLAPFRINRFEIRDGDVHFKSFNKNEPVDIYVTNLYAVATNLSNARDVKQPLPAGLTAKGKTLGGGEFSASLQMDPLASAPTFELTASLTNVDLVALNDFLRSYGKFDVDRGVLSVYTTTASDQGKYKGVVKVLFRDLKVFAWEKERTKNIVKIFWEGIVGTLAKVLKNQPHDQLAAEIPVSGTFTNSHVGMFYAAGSLLHNAFISALLPNITRKETIEDVQANKSAVPQPQHPRSTNSPATTTALTKSEPGKVSQ